MEKTIIVLPDGTQITSGTQDQPAIRSLTLTQSVNAGEELTLGSACANLLELKLFTPGGQLPLQAGDEIHVYRETDGARSDVGVFITEKPTRPTANTMALTAYDRMILLDRDLSRWLAGLNAWPYPLFTFANMVCAECGLTLRNTDIPNGTYPVQIFTAEGITGRQLIRWIGEAAGRFCRATPEGELEFAWYTPAVDCSVGPEGKAAGEAVTLSYDGALCGISITSDALKVDDDGAGGVSITCQLLEARVDDQGDLLLTALPGQTQLYYFQNTLRFEDYTVAPVERVRICKSTEDLGTVYPEEAGEKNTCIISGNPLLTASTAADLLGVAQTICDQLSGFTYTPCSVTVCADAPICPGDILQITDRNGKAFTMLVMQKVRSGQKATLSCTGSPRRDSTTAVNNQSWQALSGKVLNLQMDVSGLRVENADAAGNLAALKLSVEGIDGTVRSQSTTMGNLTEKISRLEQSGEEVRLHLRTVEENGAQKVVTQTGYTFDADGLRIRKEGQEIENLLDNTGMYVKRDEEVILQANNQGVEAVDVTVRNYLVVGGHARFEDYGSGTGCFWL